MEEGSPGSMGEGVLPSGEDSYVTVTFPTQPEARVPRRTRARLRHEDEWPQDSGHSGVVTCEKNRKRFIAFSKNVIPKMEKRHEMVSR